MVLSNSDHPAVSDVVFMIEATAVNGAYLNDLKTNYIIPALDYFRHGNFDEMNYLSASANTLYGVVIYHASDILYRPATDTMGPFSSSSKVLSAIDKLELIGGRAEYHANIAEGLATALDCFDELQESREANSNAQKHCIIICNSPPYSMAVMENHTYAGKNAEQLASLLQEMNIHLSIISPRKIPHLYKLFEKAGGDLTASQTKNYAKDPRHLVLLKGFSLKERPISPQSTPNQPSLTASLQSLPSLPSPLASNDSPIASVNSQSNQNLMGANVTAGVGIQSAVGQQQQNVYRSQNPQGINQLPSHTQQPMAAQGMVNVGMVNAARGGMMASNQFQNQPMQAPPGYHTATGGMPGANRPQNRWSMLPPQSQQRPFLSQNQPGNTTQSSALIAQLTQPPSSMSAPGQFSQAQINQNQQLRLNMLNTQGNQPQNTATQGQQNVVQPGGMNQSPGISGALAQQNNAISQPNQSQGPPSNQAVVSQPQGSQPMSNIRERHTIWSGLLEWIEKAKNASDSQKITRHVPCQVSANIKDGEAELKADGWPQKLIMQLMPKHLIGNIGGAYLKNSKSVLFHPQNCEALESLTKVMSSGFAGCVHFTSVPNPNSCDIKVLILLYTVEKRAYLGFIPNDQTAFVDRLRKVIQQQKSSQMQRQGQGGATQSVVSSSMAGNVGAAPQLPVSNPTSQATTQQQQSLMMSQTNTMAMGGGQITQNIVSSSSPSGMGGMIGQNVAGGMQPRMRMQGIQQVSSSQVNQNVGNASAMGSGMMGAPLQRAPFDNNLEAARQINLDKINQLKQTLEAAQQQEQQYKSQLEIISHMKTSQLQEALQVAQQQEMQYKMLDQQRMVANQGQGQQVANPQQQRIMRPMLNTNNPGLRHLLQQQPQYRQQLMGMQGGIGGAGARPQMNQQMQNTTANNPQQFDDVGNFDFM